VRHRIPAAFAASAVFALGAGACGEDDAASTAKPAADAPAPLAQIDQLTARDTAVKLDAGFVEALTSLKVAPGPVGTATITKGGSAVFPITGGNVTYYEPGSVRPTCRARSTTEGSGLSLTAGKTMVELEDFVVDPGGSVLTGKVSVNGEEAVASAPLFFLDGRTLNPLKAKDDGTAVLQGTTVKLKAEAADLLNKTFKIDALEEGLVIGVATITVNTA
jgi:hypothetical protein